MSRKYWVAVLEKNLDRQPDGTLLISGMTVGIALKEVAPVPTFGEGALAHTEDLNQLCVDGENSRKQPPLKAHWEDIRSITFSYHLPATHI